MLEIKRKVTRRFKNQPPIVTDTTTRGPFRSEAVVRDGGDCHIAIILHPTYLEMRTRTMPRKIEGKVIPGRLRKHGVTIDYGKLYMRLMLAQAEERRRQRKAKRGS